MGCPDDGLDWLWLWDGLALVMGWDDLMMGWAGLVMGWGALMMGWAVLVLCNWPKPD